MQRVPPRKNNTEGGVESSIQCLEYGHTAEAKSTSKSYVGTTIKQPYFNIQSGRTIFFDE